MAAPPPQVETMGDRGTDALKTHLATTTKMDIRQTRRGWLMECCCPCQARSEFKYFINNTQIANSLEESNCCMRCLCGPCYAWSATVKEINTEAELLKVERPCTMCPAGSCKCCCYQTAKVSSGGQPLGLVKETCYFCVPSYKVFDQNDNYLYLVHAPTCCCGMCPNCCAEGNPCCGKGCCKVPFWIFDPNQANTNGDAPHLGKILKRPKSLSVEVFTDAESFEVTFPENASMAAKGTLVGAALLFNSLYFEKNSQE